MKNNSFATLASAESIDKTKKSLKSNGFKVIIAETGKDAKEKALSLIPEGSEVFNSTSRTLDAIGIPEVLNESGKYKSIRNELNKLNRETQSLEMQKLGSAPEYIIGSIHAVTEDGKALIASNTGSQLPAYVYGSQHVIWVVSTKKIVKDLDEGMRRIYEYILPLEDKRLKGQYGPDVESHVRKLLIVNSELNPNRTTIIFVKEDLGF